jgi:hypothetical protein
MKYQVSKEKVLEVLRRHPALIKSINNLTEKDLAKLFTANSGCYKYTPPELKTAKNTYPFLIQIRWISRDLLESIPPRVYGEFTAKQRAELLKKDEDFSQHLPNMSVDEWMLAIGPGSTLDHIPDDILQVPAIQDAMAMHGSFTEENLSKMDEATLIRLVGINLDVYNEIPPSLITAAILEKAVAGKMNNRRIDISKVPKSVWTFDLLKATLSDHEKFYGDWPKSLLKEELCILLAQRNVYLHKLPKKTKAVLLAWGKAGASLNYYNYPLPKIFKDEAFLEEFVDYTGVNGLRTLKNNGGVTDALFLRGLRLDPECIKIIGKCGQTDEMIDALVETATSEQLDSLVNFINLTKIKKKHAPFLVNCKDDAITSLVTRKFSPPARSPKTVAPAVPVVMKADACEVELTPAEYKKYFS